MAVATRTRAPASAQKSNTDPATEALQHFRVIFKSVKKHFRWVEQQTGVNGAELWALSVVVAQPGLKVSELARALSVHQSTASNLINKLVRRKLLRRERSELDQRIVHLFALPAGARVVAEAPQPVSGVLPEALHRMSRSDLVQLNILLSGLARKMKVRDASGKSTLLTDI